MVPAGKKERTVKLGQIKPGGDVFRFPAVSYEEALSGKDESTFFMVINTLPVQAGRVSIVSLDGKLVLEKDNDHLVIPHPSNLMIGEAVMVDDV